MATGHPAGVIQIARNPVRYFAVIAFLAMPAGLLAQSPNQRTYCNPVDINYQYNFEQETNGISYRSGADPVIVNHKGEYYLFVTISGGWWHSRDLLHWDYVKPKLTPPHTWPKEDMCAPAALSVGDTLYLFQSTFDRRPIYATRTPQTGELEVFNPLLPYVPGAQGPWDPAIFHDADTDRWFMYFGSSNLYPLYGIELDFKDRLKYVATSRELIALHPEINGWERFGRDHRDTIKPFIEGAWMTKHAGKYYLQYAAPGTEYNVYANGAYVGDHPLGPFKYAPNNPVSYKPGGFMTGAGHGNTFQDNFGNYWNTGTPWIAVNFNFERRIAMFPAGFDRDGLLYANTRFGDFPHYLPTSRWQDRNELFTGWMLLSYKKPAVASSTRGPYPAGNVTDENPRTFWLASTNAPGESLTIDLHEACEVRAVQVNYTDHKAGLYRSGPGVYTQFKLHASLDGQSWQTFADLSAEKRDRPNAYIECAEPVRARYIKYEHGYVGGPNLAISDVRVFGKATGPLPSAPRSVKVRRDADARNAFVQWEEVPAATGYNVLWGIAPDKLYQTYQVFADQGTTLEVRALTLGQAYSFAVEAFNETGLSPVSAPVAVP